MRVGYLLEGVRSVLRDGGGGQGVDGRVGDIGGADKVREGTTDQTQGQIVEAQLAEAQRELSLEHLVGEMETLGILENDVHTGLGESASIHDVVRSLPSVAKWSRVVEARGLTASPG